MVVQEKELLSGAVTSCGCDGKHYQTYLCIDEDDTTYTIVTAETLCAECRELN
jgi:hypothetical protein